MKVLGMMSGTSADGIEAVIVDLDGQPPSLSWKLLHHQHVPFAADLQREILECFNPSSSGIDRVCALNFALGKAYAEAALETAKASGLPLAEIDLIANHGQTMWHIPSGSQASTLQIGAPAVIAEMTGITTISDLRSRDMAAGGQGAPMVSYMDRLLFSHPQRVRILQNIGGIANGTLLPDAVGIERGELPFAFDTGPGNMLIDDAIRRISGGQRQYDEDGQLAAQGKVHWRLLDKWIEEEPYFRLPPPKTTGRELFGAQYGARLWAEAKKHDLSDADYTATVTALTARSIAHAYRDFFPGKPQEVIVSGGGAHNPTLLSLLAGEIAPCPVRVIDELGMPSDAKEAVAFAVMAYETWHNRPGNLPSATGARRAVVLGSITPGENFARLR